MGEVMNEIHAIHAAADNDVHRALQEAEQLATIQGTDVIDYDAALYHQTVAGAGGGASQVGSMAVVEAMKGYSVYIENMKEVAKACRETGVGIAGMAQQGALVSATEGVCSAGTAATGCGISAIFACSETCYLYYQWGQGTITTAEFSRGAVGAFSGALGGALGGYAGANAGALVGACCGGVIGGPPGAAIGGLIGCG